jgi:hypothetical protein
MAITKEILDELLKDYQKPEDLLGQSGLLQQLSNLRMLEGQGSAYAFCHLSSGVCSETMLDTGN